MQQMLGELDYDNGAMLQCQAGVRQQQRAVPFLLQRHELCNEQKAMQEVQDVFQSGQFGSCHCQAGVVWRSSF
jgi:hypothetical protein